MLKIKSRKKRIAIRLLIGFLVLYCIYSAVILVRAANYKIYIEQMADIGGFEAKKVEITDLKQKVILIKIIDKRYFTTERGEWIAQCPKGELRITVEGNGIVNEFYPATDACKTVFYEDKQTYFQISIKNRQELNSLWLQYSFPIFPDVLYVR